MGTIAPFIGFGKTAAPAATGHKDRLSDKWVKGEPGEHIRYYYMLIKKAQDRWERSFLRGIRDGRVIRPNPLETTISTRAIFIIDLTALINYIPPMTDKIQYRLLGYLAGMIYRLYSSTWRYDITFMEGATPIDTKAKSPYQSLVFGHWHGDELALIAFCKHSKFLALSSQSKDGTIMAAALKVMGMDVARGSSTRGGMRALVSMIRMVKESKYYVNFALDGPKGPRHQAKPGIHMFAYKAGIPIYQCIVRCDRKWVFDNTWNKAILPKPFAKIFVYLYELPQATEENRDQILDAFNSRISAPK